MKHSQKGYTLIELIAVAGLIMILTTLAVALYPYVERARIARAVGDIGEIHMRVQTFDLNNRRYPTSLTEIDLDGQLDPWGNPYQFLPFDNVEGNGPKRKDHAQVPVNTNYDIYSMGPDGVTATPFTSIPGRDDVAMAGDGTFFGQVGDYK